MLPLLALLCLVSDLKIEVAADGQAVATPQELLQQLGFGDLLLKRQQRGLNRYADCILPVLENGAYTIKGSSDTPVPGNPAFDLTFLQFTCNPSFTLTGPSIIVCDDGNWSPSPPTCAANINCILPEFPNNGRYGIVGSTTPVIPGTEVNPLTIIEFECDEAYILTGRSVNVCRNQDWNPGLPTCEPRAQCVVPDSQTFGRYSFLTTTDTPIPGDLVEEHQVLLFTCPESKRLMGPPVIVCSRGKWLTTLPDCIEVAADCSEISTKVTGMYWIQYPGQCTPSLVKCDFDVSDGDWTVIQSRFDGSVDFYQTYETYQAGFGDAAGEYWMGLENIHQLTKGGNFELLVELKAFNGTFANARYSNFKVNSEDDGYQLELSGYCGTAGDSMADCNGNKFSAKNKDQDASPLNCAQSRKGGWWYDKCSNTNLNGIYFPNAVVNATSIFWWDLFTGVNALKETRMLIRPKMED